MGRGTRRRKTSSLQLKEASVLTGHKVKTLVEKSIVSSRKI